MIIVLLLFFKSICLYCQRLVLHIYDRWINPKNVRLLKEAAEAKGPKFQVEDYRESKKSKRRHYASTSSTSGGEGCRFCANTPQGYCRHHFHLQELHVQKQQRQQKFWCPLSGVISGPNRSTEYRQLRKIKRELKHNIQQQQQQLKSAKLSRISDSTQASSNLPTPSSSSSAHQSNNDSGYQTVSMNTSATVESRESSDLFEQQLHSDPAAVNTFISSHDYVDIELPSQSASFVETTYNFQTGCETPHHSISPISTTTSFNSFVSCEYPALSTTYL